MPFCRFLLIVLTVVCLFLICNSQVEASPQSASSGNRKASQSENQVDTQAKTIARGTHASQQIFTWRLKFLENLGLWKMLTLGASVTSTVAMQRSAITGIGTISTLYWSLEPAYYTQRSMGLLRALKTSILVSKDVTIRLYLL